MSVLVATAYMEEAERYDWLVAIDAGEVLATGSPLDLRQKTGTDNLDDAFIALLPQSRQAQDQGSPASTQSTGQPSEQHRNALAIEAHNLTLKFGSFTAVKDVSFAIPYTTLFRSLGSNGCGKTTTMKMLTGLLPASEGQAWLFGSEVSPKDIETRRRVGYMTQAFSLYSELTVRQNLVLHARLFAVPEEQIPARVEEMIQRFGLADAVDSLPSNMPLGMRQRLSLAVAMVHKPELLILDEPTSGVDPVARDAFWRLLIELSRKDGVTIFLSTHFMNEAERCDRMSMMHAGVVLDSDEPAKLVEKRGAADLEEAFIGYLLEAGAGTDQPQQELSAAPLVEQGEAVAPRRQRFSLQRMLSYLWREALELQRDPIRATLALAGSIMLMFVIGFGISLDVEDLRYAVLDRDDTSLSRDYALQLSGSRYFIEQPPLSDYQELDRRMRSGEVSLAIEIPHGFARDALAGRPVEIGAWVDGAMPLRAETLKSYVQGMHQHWLVTQLSQRGGALPTGAQIQTRFRYNPDVQSLPAMVPAVIPLLLLMIPAMLTALAVVREKETGSITNFYVTPVTRSEFLLGKQLPYVALAMVNFLLMSLLAVTVFGVPITGSFFALALAALVFSFAATGMGLLASSITRSQIAAMFFAMIGTMVPATQFSGLIDPVSSLEGAGQLIGQVYPATHMVTISRGVFSKALGLAELSGAFWAMLLSVPVIMGLAVMLLKKQER